VALLEKRRFLYNHSGDFPQVILIVPSHVPNTFVGMFFLPITYYTVLYISNYFFHEKFNFL
jgi:hypothetical protein